MITDGRIRIRLLGRPLVIAGGEIVEFPTRKTAALLFHIAAAPGQRIERRRIAGLLWGETGEDQAAASVRKALSHLGRAPATRNLIGKDRTHVWFAGDAFRTDLALFNSCIDAGTPPALNRALDLWRGEPLEAFDAGSLLFDEWVQTFRAEVARIAHRHVSEQLAALSQTRGNDDLKRPLSELIVRIEPTDTAGNAYLIRARAADGDIAGAKRHFRKFAQALADIEVPVPQEITDMVARLAEPGSKALPGANHAARRSWPSIAVTRPSSAQGSAERCATVHSELLLQLSRFRALRCFDDSGDLAGGGPGVVRLTSGEDHDFRIVLWDQPERNAVFVHCLNARQNHTVSCLRLPYRTLENGVETERAISTCINGIEQDINNDDGSLSDTVYGQWIEAFKLMSQWTRQSDGAALEILDDLSRDERGRRMGRVHAAIGSILMIQRLIVPQRGQSDREKLTRAREWIHRALAVDRLEPFCHVSLGWLRVQTGDCDRALAAFDKALDLNPYSARTLIASAEAHAFCGRIDRSRELARQAIAAFGPGMPADVHGYLANIAYLSGELESCRHHLDRAPENLHSALLAVAVHQERGDETAAARARVAFEQEMRRARPEVYLDGQGLSRWIEASSMIRTPRQRERMFAALERAGVMVAHAGRAIAGSAQLSGR